MQKSCRVGFMYGELTDKSTIGQIDQSLDEHQQDQFEILLYKKNRKFFLNIEIKALALNRWCAGIHTGYSDIPTYFQPFQVGGVLQTLYQIIIPR